MHRLEGTMRIHLLPLQIGKYYSENFNLSDFYANFYDFYIKLLEEIFTFRGTLFPNYIPTCEMYSHSLPYIN